MLSRFLTVFAVVLVLAVSGMAEGLPESYRQALKAIKTEKKVADAFWQNPGLLWVGMKSDGTNRSGYAEYLCLVLSDYDIHKVDVVIKDYQKLMLKKEFVTMGVAYCP